MSKTYDLYLIEIIILLLVFRLVLTFKDEYTSQRNAYSMGLFGLNSSQTADFPDMARPRIAECFLSALDSVSNLYIGHIHISDYH